MPRLAKRTWRHLDLAEGETIRQCAEAYLARNQKPLAKDPVASEAEFIRLADAAMNPTHRKIPLRHRCLATTDDTRFMTVLERAIQSPNSGVLSTILAFDQRADASGPSTLHAGVRYLMREIWLPVRVQTATGDTYITHYQPCARVRSFSRKADRRPDEVKALRTTFRRCNDHIAGLAQACEALDKVPITVEYGAALIGLAQVTEARHHVPARHVIGMLRSFVRLTQHRPNHVSVLDVLWAVNSVLRDSTLVPMHKAMRLAEGLATFILAEFVSKREWLDGRWPRDGGEASFNVRPSTPDESAPTLPFADAANDAGTDKTTEVSGNG